MPNSTTFDDPESVPFNGSQPAYEEKKEQVAKSLSKAVSNAELYTAITPTETASIPAQTDARYQQLQNLALEQDIKLKGAAFNRLFTFLAIETVAVFIMSIFQALGLGGFHLEEWSFRLLLASTIVQITVMLSVAVKSLFPEK